MSQKPSSVQSALLCDASDFLVGRGCGWGREEVEGWGEIINDVFN